ncbi:hypothetical protein Rhe02_54310 [Rhizocola hellebori]|uniref:Uncharacterized protein n=1 Tax=Rhizocola hellebori TaxID=1392758 RepID=A0A8J3QAT9_9ACTN|nr:hypothetical protein [Rhizocola hellebori]GIH07364.1 hypothetical protein Rhe02_54310 [Rhizocola hellebori]
MTSSSPRLAAAEIPTEVLHQLYRDYCLSKHVYAKAAYADDAARQAHIDDDARSYYEEAHMGPLAELVKAAYAAGRESVLHEPNDIEATGGCCCNGCIGEGRCDLYDPADADERMENDAERIAEMTPDELARWGE